MNSKTTVILLLLVVAVGATIMMVKEKVPEAAPPKLATPPRAMLEQDLFEDDFGNVTTISVTRDGGEEWRFERKPAEEDAPMGDWMITAPFEAKAQKWAVDSIARGVNDARYTIKYDKGDIDPASVGLEPTRTTVELTNAEGKTRVLQIGRHEGENETYVRVGTDGEIYRVKPALKHQLKERILDYRDQQLFAGLSADDIVHVELTDRSGEEDPVTYNLVKNGTDWVFESPAKANGVNDKIRSLCSSFAGLRVTEWTKDNVEDFATFGLDPAAITITVTAQTTPKAEDDDQAEDSEQQPQPEPITTQYTAHIASSGPLGDDTKVYVRKADEPFVGTIMQSTYDGFKPNLKQWRDNSVTHNDPKAAKTIELTVEGESVKFVRTGLNWSYETQNVQADSTEIEALLNAVKALEAVNFVDGASSNPAEFGLDNPRATVVVTFANEESETIAIGGFADPDTKRMTYVRNGQSDSVAKVRVAGTRTILRPLSIYRNKTVIETGKDAIQGVSIDRRTTGDDRRETISLTKAGENWSITAPKQATPDEEAVKDLLDTLDELRAAEVLDGSDDPSAYGLDTPDVKLSYTFLPNIIYRLKVDEDADTAEDDSSKNTLEPYQPPAETRTLLIAEKDGRVYVAREEAPQTAYAMNANFLPKLQAEFRDKDLFTFTPEDATAVTLQQGDSTRGLLRNQDAWQYAQEPDLPLDEAKVKSYLLGLDNLEASRYVEYGASDLTQYGLDAPEYTLTIELADGPALSLLVSAKTDPGGGHYGLYAGNTDVLLLPSDVTKRIMIDIAELEAAP